ncbi:uncharacterized protein LOC111117223 [Crassostrea virginica]
MKTFSLVAVLCLALASAYPYYDYNNYNSRYMGMGQYYNNPYQYGGMSDYNMMGRGGYRGYNNYRYPSMNYGGYGGYRGYQGYGGYGGYSPYRSSYHRGSRYDY